MLRLNIPREPRWVAVGLGVEFQILPITAAIMAAARSRAARQLHDMRRTVEEAKAAGIPCDLPDVTDPHVAAGHAFALTVLAVGREAIRDWRGVADANGQPAAFDVGLLPQVLTHPSIAEAFDQAVTAAMNDVAAEGNA